MAQLRRRQADRAADQRVVSRDGQIHTRIPFASFHSPAAIPPLGICREGAAGPLAMSFRVRTRLAGFGRAHQQLVDAAAVHVDHLEAPAVGVDAVARPPGCGPSRRSTSPASVAKSPGAASPAARGSRPPGRRRGCRPSARSRPRAAPRRARSSAPTSGSSPAMLVRMSVGVASPSSAPYSSTTSAMCRPGAAEELEQLQRRHALADVERLARHLAQVARRRGAPARARP